MDIARVKTLAQLCMDLIESGVNLGKELLDKEQLTPCESDFIKQLDIITDALLH